MHDDFNCYSESELRSYLLTLAEIAQSDGLHKKEKDYIELQSVLAGIDPRTIWENSAGNFSALTEIPLTLKSLLIRDAITLAHIDQEYTEQEHDKLIELARRMHYPEYKVEEIRKWLMDYWALLATGNTLFSQEE